MSGASGIDFSVPEHELVLRVMNFSAPESDLVLRAWILVLWSMNWGLLNVFGAHLGVCWASLGTQGLPGGSQEAPKAHFGIQLQRNRSSGS